MSCQQRLRMAWYARTNGRDWTFQPEVWLSRQEFSNNPQDQLRRLTRLCSSPKQSLQQLSWNTFHFSVTTKRNSELPLQSCFHAHPNDVNIDGEKSWMNRIEIRQQDQTAARYKSPVIFCIQYNTFRPRYLKGEGGETGGLNGNVQWLKALDHSKVVPPLAAKRQGLNCTLVGAGSWEWIRALTVWRHRMPLSRSAVDQSIPFLFPYPQM
jgi:hypothetical protein